MKLGEYMKKNMFDPVGASDITFHLNERSDLQSRKVKLWERDNDRLKEVTDFWWPEPVVDDIGGGGIYANVLELLKIYLGVMQGKLLRPETLELMFKPHLESRKNLDNPEEHCLANRNAIYNAVPNYVPVDYGLGGLINTVEVPDCRSKYSLSWSGLPNCYWVCICTAACCLWFLKLRFPQSLYLLLTTDISTVGRHRKRRRWCVLVPASPNG
jgi:CubicO group peptidase (beta-lactamase class C family)